jgi:hypothetical protein
MRKCSTSNCQCYSTCRILKYWKKKECETKKVRWKIDESVPDQVCKDCEFLQNGVNCSLHKTGGVQTKEIAKCKVDLLDILDAGTVCIRSEHIFGRLN